MIKACFFDLDGTILSHTKYGVPASTYLAISKLQEKGIKCILATGRHIREVEDLPGNDIKFDAYLLLNCQLFLDSNRQFIGGTPIEGQMKEDLLTAFNEKKFAVVINEQERIYTNCVTETFKVAHENVHTRLEEIDEYSGKPIYQFVFFMTQEEQDALLQQFPYLVFERWDDNGCDVIYKGNNKATGIMKYCQENNLSLDEIVCFGDGENDVSMIEKCGYGVAMGNGCLQVKEVADYVTDHIDNDGLYKALVHLKLIEE